MLPVAGAHIIIDISMFKFLLLSALCVCLVCAPVRAQDVAPADVAAASGAQLFAEARALIVDGPNGEPLATEKLAPDENLRLQRLAVARNAPALAKLRAALRAYIVLPAFDYETPDKALSHLDSTGAVRNFARHLAQEAAVRAADGDALGAAQSSLDALELSSQAARGPIINALVGVATAAIARRSLTQNIGALDAAQLRQVAARWEKISGNFPTYAQTLRDEEQLNLRLTYQNLAADIAQWNDPVAMAQAEAELKEARAEGEMTDEEWKEANESFAQVKGLTFADITAETRAIFDGALARANQPYFVARTQAPLRGKNPIAELSAQLLNSANSRFPSERNIVNNRELVAALRLRAAKLESGQYPATFDAGADPFSPTLAPMIYKRAGDSYVLYSVGPDGKDDNGAEIQTLITDAKTGVKTVSDRLAPESTGDILAPVL